jgi:hypothetical protein
MKPFEKIINPGTMPLGRRNRQVYCRITYSAAGRLSITGVVGPWHSGSCAGPCGQIVGELANIDRFHRGWGYQAVRRFMELWNEWHLNDIDGKEVPDTAIQFLMELPETKNKPAWV